MQHAVEKLFKEDEPTQTLENTTVNSITVPNNSMVNVEGGVRIFVDTNNNVTIYGQNSLSIHSEGDLDIDAKNVNIHARESMVMSVDGDVYLGSSSHIIQQAPRIDLNPNIESSGYYGNIKNRVLKMFKHLKMKKISSRIICEEVRE